MQCCQIKWIDEAGQSTPDNNPAIGRVILLAIQELLSGKDWDMDTLVTVSEIVANAGYEIAPLAWEDGQ